MALVNGIDFRKCIAMALFMQRRLIFVCCFFMVRVGILVRVLDLIGNSLGVVPFGVLPAVGFSYIALC